MSKRISLANSMPLTVGVIMGAFVACYMLAALIAETRIGRPSSTAAIGFLFVPVYSGIVALVGVGIGFLVRAGLKNRGEKDNIPIKHFLLKSAIVLIITSGLAAAIGIKGVVDYETLNVPQLLSNSGELHRTELFREDTPSVEAHAKLIWDFQNESIEAITWNGSEVIANVTQSTKLDLNVKGIGVLHYDVGRYSYLSEIAAMPFPDDSDTDNYFAVLAKLRPTSFRSMLLIYDANGKLVYEELLRRCGRKQYMGIVDGIDEQYLIVDVCSPISVQAKRPHPAPYVGG